MKKDLGITEVRGAKANISDLVVYGDGDTFALLCKASSKKQGWMKSTKVCNLPGGCIVQVTTQQENPDGSYAVAEALTYVPGVNMDKDADPRVLKQIGSGLTRDTKIHLCDTCGNHDHFPECMPNELDIEFGDGVGNDNIIRCVNYLIN